MAGAAFGDVAVSLFVAGETLGDFGLRLLVAGAILGDVGASPSQKRQHLVILEA